MGPCVMILHVELGAKSLDAEVELERVDHEGVAVLPDGVLLVDLPVEISWDKYPTSHEVRIPEFLPPHPLSCLHVAKPHVEERVR